MAPKLGLLASSLVKGPGQTLQLGRRPLTNHSSPSLSALVYLCPSLSTLVYLCPMHLLLLVPSICVATD